MYEYDTNWRRYILVFRNLQSSIVLLLIVTYMATDNPTPRTFLSYCWADVATAESIDKDFQSIGITLTRDIRDIGYFNSIRRFMESIGEHDFVVMIISDDYLKRKNCMYEACEVIGNHRFSQKVLPVLLDNVRHIFDHNNRIPYYKLWKERVETLTAQVSEYPTNEDLINELRIHQSIYLELDAFFRIIVDMNLPTFKQLKKDNYMPMLERMGVKDPNIMAELFATNLIEGSEEQKVAIENLVIKHPENKYGWFRRAWMANRQKQFSTAKEYYECALRLDENYAIAHNNYAILLSKHFKKYKEAREHYEKALMLNPDNARTHYNYAILLKNYFEDNDGAREHYETAIRLNPRSAKAHHNYAILLKNYFKDYERARKHYETAIMLSPDNAKTRYNYAILLKNHF